MADPSDFLNPAPDHPGVRIPPPFIYVGGFVMGLALEKAFPIFKLPEGAGRVAAVLCVALWVILSIWSIGLFRKARTSFIPVKPATAIVISGPYRFTRNPMYLGFLSLYLGLALWFGVFWALILVPAVVWVVQAYVIKREEKYLEQKFGQEYLNYKSRVRRWI